MQGLADGYFVIPYTLGQLPRRHAAPGGHDRSRRLQRGGSRRRRSASTRCSRSRARDTPRAVPPRARRRSCWDDVGMARNDAGPDAGARARSRSCATSSGRTSRCPATPNNLNQNLEYAGRVADYLEFAELLALDALHRTESCGGHFREESQTPDGEALRDDDALLVRRRRGSSRASARRPTLHKEPLTSNTSSRRSGATSEAECSIHL